MFFDSFLFNQCEHLPNRFVSSVLNPCLAVSFTNRTPVSYTHLYGTGPSQWALVYTNPEEPGRACFLLQTGEGEHRPVTMGDEESGFVYLPDSLAVEGDTVTASFREGEGSDQVHDLSLQFTRPAEREVRFTAGETLRTLTEEEA